MPGVSYRNLLLWRGEKLPCPFTSDTRTRAPHDITDQSVLEDHPRGPGSDVLCDLMAASIDVFRDHPVNAARQAAGKGVATNVWLWGLGQAPTLRAFADEYGPRGAMITAVDLLRGIAALVGWDRIEVPGATGYLDTDYAAKGRAGVEALNKYDIVCVHVEASDEASHEGRCDEKVKAIEEIDRHVVGPLVEALAKARRLADHDLARPPHVPANQSPHARQRPRRHGRHRHRGRRVHKLRRHERGQVETGVRRGLGCDAVVYWEEIIEHGAHGECGVMTDVAGRNFNRHCIGHL